MNQGLSSLLCCGCWALPLAVLGAYTVIRAGITSAWRKRGLEDGVVYCANCRFDLRGATSFQCSECGGTIYPSSLLMTALQPPAGLLTRAAFYLIAGFAPTVFALYLLGTALPFNYHDSREAEFAVAYTQDAHTQFGSLHFYADSSDGLFGVRESDRVRIDLSYELWQHAVEHAPAHPKHSYDVDWRDTQAVHDVWDRIGIAADLPDETDPEELRDAFVRVARSVGRGVEPDLGQHSTAFRLERWDRYQYEEPHQGYILFGIFILVIGMLGLIVLAARHQQRAEVEYTETVQAVYKKFETLVNDNRQAMGSVSQSRKPDKASPATRD